MPRLWSRKARWSVKLAQVGELPPGFFRVVGGFLGGFWRRVHVYKSGVVLVVYYHNSRELS